jgi:acyl-CoA thioesterase
MGGALYSRMEEGESCATVEIKIAYFRPVISGTLTCVTKVIQRTKTLAFMESEVTVADKPVARAMGTFSIFDAGRSK